MLKTIFTPYIILLLVLINDVKVHQGNFQNCWGSYTIIFSYYVKHPRMQRLHSKKPSLSHKGLKSLRLSFESFGLLAKWHFHIKKRPNHDTQIYIRKWFT